jgi:hypothetical protein
LSRTIEPDKSRVILGGPVLDWKRKRRMNEPVDIDLETH